MNSKPFRDLPVASIAVVALCVLLWLLRTMQGGFAMDTRTATLVDWGACVPLDVLTGEPWRLVTAIFLHVDIVHLGLNMLILGLTAANIERGWGSLRMLAIFVVGGILANAGVTAWAELQATPAHFGGLLKALAGSSGGFMALLGAMLVPSLLGALGQQPYAEAFGGRIDTRVLWPIAINIGICFVIPQWDPSINIAGTLAGLALGAILLAAPQHAGTAAGLLRFAAVGVLLAACVGGLARGGDREFLGQLRVEYDEYMAAHR